MVMDYRIRGNGHVRPAGGNGAAGNGAGGGEGAHYAGEGPSRVPGSRPFEEPDRPFDRNAALRPPILGANALPETPPPARPSLKKAFFAHIGEVSGAVVDFTWNQLGRFGKGMTEQEGSVWTTWDEKPLYPALFQLAYMRDMLEKNNLKDPYPAGALTAFQDPNQVPPPATQYFRTPDGSWNDPKNPREGSVDVRFPRNVNADAAHGEGLPQLLDPSPALVSQELLARKNGEMKPVPFLNLLAASWIQFMVHDWVSHRTYRPDAPLEKVIHVPLPKDHPGRQAFGDTPMSVGKTMEDPTRQRGEAGPATLLNEVTSWWDGSQLYGSDTETRDSLRTGEDGKLKLDGGEFLPVAGGVEQVGYNKNWWVGLSLLHTLFAREHNAICDELKKSHPDWDDDQLFQVARLVNAAVMAKIHTVEWTPAILPNRRLKVAMEANWYGLLESRLHRRNRKVLRRVKVANGVIGGLVGNKTEKYGAPYGLSEEFVAVYRLHELLPDSLRVHSLDDDSFADLPLEQTRLRHSPELVREHGVASLLYSFGIQHPGQLTLHNYPDTLRTLNVPGSASLDLAAVDILRSRERGIPRYNAFRSQLGLHPIKTFEDLTNDPADLAALKRVYRNVDEIDMAVGTRAETDRPAGFGFGETLFQIFILNASRRLQADRFFTESYNAETYTQEGLDWVDRATFKSVLLRHYPELSHTGLARVDNAFEPWELGELTKEQHPLRFVDPQNPIHAGIENAVEALQSGVRLARGFFDYARSYADGALTKARAATNGASVYDPLPPGSFGLPIVGESLSFVGNSGPFLDERFRKHGAVFKTHIALHPTVCFGGKDAYRFFLTNPDLFTRAGGAPPNVEWLFDKKSLTFQDGPATKRVQALLLDAFKDGALQSYLPVMNRLFSDSIARCETDQRFHWVPEVEALAFALIDCVFMGAAPEVKRGFWTRAFDRLTGGVVTTPFSPKLYWALLHRLFFGHYVDGAIDRRVRVPGKDVVSHLLAGNGTDKLTMEELKVELVHFFLAGAPLASALAYHLLFLAQHPEVMEKAREEVLRVAPSGDVSLEQYKELHYVLATCKESRRAARLVSNTFFARVTRPFEYNGYQIPSGWRAMGLIVATQHDPGTFARPEEYDPSRFVDEGIPPAKPHPRECPMYVAHGGKDDTHACIGERFTDLTMAVFTARLLQRHTWSLVPHQDLSPRFGKVAPVPAGGLHVIFHPTRTAAQGAGQGPPTPNSEAS